MSSFSNAPAWSMGHRSKSTNIKKQQTKIPGPGNYELNSTIYKKTPGWKIGNSLRQKIATNYTPGPGQYNSISKVNMKQGPKITMGVKSKAFFNQHHNNIPGPGNYQINDGSINKIYTGFTMGSRYNATDKNQEQPEPGPGSYNLNENKKSGIKIGTSKRAFQKDKQHIPGPGAYTIDNSNRPNSAGPHFTFSGGSKNYNDNGKYETNPGPGQYNYDTIMSSISNKGVTIGQKFNKNYNSISNLPGPGQYQSNLKRPMSGAKIGKAQRHSLGNSIGPGPGAYDCSGGNNKKSACKIGTGKRQDMGKNETPGPGSYDTNLIDNRKNGVTISGIKNKKNIQITPGPGAYDPTNDDNRNRPYSAKIGKASRSKFDNSYTPGPGSYNINLSNDKNYKFAYTKQLRSNDTNIKQPGPGQYDIPLTVPSVPYYELSNPKFYNSGYSKLL